MKKLLVLALICAVGLCYAENYAKYLIICADTLYNSIQPLAEWKQATGLSTRVVKLSTIGSDTNSIRHFVRVAYDSGPVRPEYLLLVGSPLMLPAGLYWTHGWLNCSSDNIYADVNGTIEAEITTGRYPAWTPAQLDVMVAKTLMYEKTPDLTDSLWMRRLTTIIREDMDPNDSIYWNNVRNAARKAAAAGFVNCDSLSYLHGHKSTAVMNSLNAGTGLVMYRGSAINIWYTPFDSVKPGRLTSTNKLPIICSITCQTMTLAAYDPPMMGDSFMRAGTLSDLHGGVAYFGNTHPAHGVGIVRSKIALGFFDGLFDENIWKLGKTVLYAKHQLYAAFPDSINDYRGFGLLGDPDLGVWTATPKILTVEHPSDIFPGPQQLHVTVSTNTIPVANALVCASMDTTVYACDSTDSTGAVDLTIAPLDTGEIRLVVTGRNLYPYDGYIHVNATAVSEPAPVGPGAFAGLTATPAVVTRTCRLSWSPVLASQAQVCVYDAQGRHVLSLSARGSSLVLSTSSLASGVYLAVLRDRFGQAHGQVRITKLK